MKEVREIADSFEVFPADFELITAIAFLYFYIEKCDFVIMEVGLGGRLDATNVVENPLITLITSISLDHQQFLGNTISEIAREKGGIIKDKVPVVLYNQVNATLETMPLLEKNQFLPDYAALSEQVKEAAKMMYLNYPSNPTAAVAPLSFFEDTVEFAKARDIMVVHDFAYGGIGFDGKKPVSFLQADGAKDVGIETYSMSKTFNMAGWRVGFAVGNEQMIEAIHTLQDHLFIDIFPAIQHAAIEALGEDQSAVDELVAMYESRRNAFVQACHDIGWNVHAPEASFFAWLPVPAPHTSESFADLLLKESHVAVAPGHGFGTYGEGYVRIGLLESEERLVEAVQRIAKLKLF